MKYLIPLILLGCSTTPSTLARSMYIGNGQYEILSDGDADDSEKKVRGALYEKAFRLCEKDGQGFKILKTEDSSVQNRYHYFPGMRATIQCEGSVDQKLVEQFKDK